MTDLRSRTRRNLTPVVGGITAVATATGAFAAVAHVAPAGAEADSAASALGAAGLAGAGTFESCDAYFGFGKEEGVLGAVDFDVVDINGDDGVDHDVDSDTTVRLVLVNDEDEVLECVPFEITEEQWNDEYEEDAGLPPYPGPGHFAYPSVNLDPFIEDFGPVVEVGFRVVTIPGGDHSLVSPEGVHELDDVFLNPEETFEGDIIDQRVLDHIAAGPGAEAAAAFAEARECPQDFEDPSDDPALLAAANHLLELIGEDEFEFEEVSCFDADALHAFASYTLAAFESAGYTEEIQLSLPEAATPTPTTPAEPPAAQPATAAPSFTG